MKVGQKVYIPELGVIGTVISVDGSGKPEKVKVGTKIIKAVDFIIEHISDFVFILKYIKNIFKK